MDIGLITLFPQMFTALSEHGVSSRAIKSKLVNLHFWNPRDFTTDKHRTVDDKPFGGGPGMLMKTGPLLAAISAAKEQLEQPAPVLYLSPQGRRLNQAAIRKMSTRRSMILLCGRYQGIDARVLDSVVDEEWSLGDFVISGGELAAMALIDAITRLQPGALGDADSARQDSFAEGIGNTGNSEGAGDVEGAGSTKSAGGLLHWPEYTRPQEFEGQQVPSVLLSGDHEAIRRWRLQQSLATTWRKRPDLLDSMELDAEQQELLQQIIKSSKV
ncbi:MAG: tRNA (guanosine(37)-N1)-methyltransferase TrmD [Pseudohongiellaceae bacterium]